MKRVDICNPTCYIATRVTYVDYVDYKFSAGSENAVV